ncbi:sulfur carrier protein ThiS [Bacterioplanoides sp.]|uniref:sulfur carrier protein ThiS n=1 Tax=Bacterioplanoides sp. TaxID=2066072 RepID=UPI003B00ED42
MAELTLAINGAPQSFTNIKTLQQLLIELGYFSDDGQPKGNVVVALNQAIVSAALFNSTELKAGDQLDILGAITGG